MNQEKIKELYFKELTISELIEILQHLQGTDPSTRVFARDYNGDCSPVFGMDVYLVNGTIKICP